MHANARLNLHGRRLLIARIQQGRPIAHVADELGISRQTAYKWWGRWRREGDVGLGTGRVARTGARTQTAASLERRIVAVAAVAASSVRPASAGIVEMPASTVHRVLCRHGLNRLAGWTGRPGRVIRRDRHRPARRARPRRRQEARADPTRWRLAGPRPRQRRALTRTPRSATRYVHSAIDATPASPTARSSTTRQGVTAAGFWDRAHACFDDARHHRRDAS